MSVAAGLGIDYSRGSLFIHGGKTAITPVGGVGVANLTVYSGELYSQAGGNLTINGIIADVIDIYGGTIIGHCTNDDYNVIGINAVSKMNTYGGKIEAYCKGNGNGITATEMNTYGGEIVASGDGNVNGIISNVMNISGGKIEANGAGNGYGIKSDKGT